ADEKGPCIVYPSRKPLWQAGHQHASPSGKCREHTTACSPGGPDLNRIRTHHTHSSHTRNPQRMHRSDSYPSTTNMTHTSADFCFWKRFFLFRVESDFRLYMNRHIVLHMTSPRRSTDADAYMHRT
ncbi:unnamed protein product, partial [Ectocarpus sp. 12 AP-2014]